MLTKNALISAFFAVALAGAAHADLAVGSPAPDFTLTGDSGKPVSLSDAKGKLVVLEWVNKGCPFVRAHYDCHAMQALQKRYAAKGVEWFSIASSAEGQQGYFATPADAAAFRKARHAAMTAVLLDPDGKVGAAYGAKTTPDMFVIAKDGTIAYEGAIDDKATTEKSEVLGAHNYVAQALDELMAGKPVSVPETRSYGCSVKYKQP